METNNLIENVASEETSQDQVLKPSQLQSHIKSCLYKLLPQELVIDGILAEIKITGGAGHITGKVVDEPKDGDPVDLNAKSSLQFWFWKSLWPIWKENYYPYTDLADFKNKKVRLHGKVQYFENGQVYLNVTHIQLRGVAGETERDRVKKVLERTGVFAEGKEKCLPKRVEQVGIIYGENSAGLSDFVTTMADLNPFVKVFYFPATVQGASAPQSIAKAIRQATEFTHEGKGLDALVVGRGGGSQQDLSAFDTELVVKAIAHTTLPVIVSVGHSTDSSLSDLATNYSVITPTAAPKLLLGNNVLEDYAKFLLLQDHQLVAQFRTTLKELIRYVGDVEKEKNELLEARREDVERKLVEFDRILDSRNPQNLLRFGSVIALQQGITLRKKEQYDPTQPITLLFADGELVLPPTEKGA